jgi:uncharacterized protein (DUF885 family)
MHRRPGPLAVALLLSLSTCVLAQAQPAPAAGDVEGRRRNLSARLAALVENEAELADAQRLREFIELYHEHTLLVSPEFGTFIGHPTGHDRWSDASLAEVERQEEEARRALAFLRTLDRGSLEGADRLNLDLLLDEFEQSVAGQRFAQEYLLIDQMGGPHSNMPRVLQRNPARTVADYEAILSRLGGVAARVGEVEQRLRRGLELGVTPPRVTLVHVGEQIAAAIPAEAAKSPFLEPFQRIPAELPPAERERLAAAAERVYREEIVPAFGRFGTFVTATYVPGARETIAMRELPEGAAWYAFNARQSTTTDMTPEQIHQLGLAEVARIRAEMETVKARTGFAGKLEDFFTFLRTDPQFFYTDADDLLAGYRDICKRIDPGLIRLFGRLPRLPYGVKEIPAEIARTQTTAYYEGGSLEAAEPGWFFANTYDLASRPKWEMEALSLHEAVPGHHLQIALAAEQQELPWFRRFGYYTAFGEGWGLYAESLGDELGLYQDPYSKFGQLTYEMWRAVRLVVDTGMHHLGWSRQQAIDYFRANAGKAEHDIVVEIDRYIVWPGQALAYKVGELKIQELRRWAQSELGERFDLREFHDTVLGNGALPLAVLEQQVRDWVAAEQAAR